MSGLYETTEATMIAAHKAGIEYWKMNRPENATDENLRSLARSRHWHDADNDSFLAGFRGAQLRQHVEQATILVRRCQRDFKRELTNGERRDLLADNCVTWSLDHIRKVVGELGDCE